MSKLRWNAAFALGLNTVLYTIVMAIVDLLYFGPAQAGYAAPIVLHLPNDDHVAELLSISYTLQTVYVCVLHRYRYRDAPDDIDITTDGPFLGWLSWATNQLAKMLDEIRLGDSIQSNQVRPIKKRTCRPRPQYRAPLARFCPREGQSLKPCSGRWNELNPWKYHWLRWSVSGYANGKFSLAPDRLADFGVEFALSKEKAARAGQSS